MDRRDEILKIATDLIQTYGFNGFSYNDISKAIGIRKASIHHHFPSKEDLGIAYCSAKYDELANFRESIKVLGSAREKMLAYLNKPKSRLGNRKMCGINAMQSDCSSMSKALRKAVKEVANFDILIVEEILREGRKQGEFVLFTSVKLQAALIVSAIKGALQRSLLNNDDSYDEVKKSLLRMLYSY